MWMDLFVDRADRRGLSSALYEQIRSAIVDGRLQPAQQIPTSRALAADLGVARSTIATVYGRLTAEGYLDGRTGAGTFVAAFEQNDHDDDVDPSIGPTDPPVPIRIDLRTGRPDPALFPLASWRRCAVSGLQAPPPGYGDLAGMPLLRQTLATWISRSRGVAATPSRVIVTAGAQQAFFLIGRSLVGRGRCVAVEQPGYVPAAQAFAAAGCGVVGVPVDDEGIDVDRIPAGADAVYVTPSHQLPTGVTMSNERRRALLDLARRRDLLVIEDDYDTEFRYVDRPLEPLQRLDADGRVVYIGTFSKSLTPSLRIGFVVAPSALVDRLVDAKREIDAQPPHLTQAALAVFLADGHFDRHLRRARRVYRERHHVVTDQACRLVDMGLVTASPVSNAGLHCMLELPATVDARALVARLAEQGVAVFSTVDDAPPPVGLLVGFGLAGTDELVEAFALIERELAAALDGPDCRDGTRT
jgi:GntR family transcriptional regulator/MocR family aminotransferase